MLEPTLGLHAQHATFWRAALLLGLASGDAVVAWADNALQGDSPMSSRLYNVSLVPPTDLTGLRDALQPIAQKRESNNILMALFDRAHLDLESGKRNLEDTVRVLAQLRRAFQVPAPWFDELDALEDDYMLAVAGVIGDVPTCDKHVRAWLGQFTGEEQKVLG